MNKNYRNEYLFSETYLQNITQLPIIDENLKNSFRTIKGWRDEVDNTSPESWITIYIENIFDTLKFGHKRNSEKEPNILMLFPDIDKINAMSLCYIIPPEEDINCTLKGKFWAEKIIRNLRKNDFQWGILTDGFYWRIYHSTEPNPYETYVEINLETILNSQDYTAFQIFYFFFRPDNFINNKSGECNFDIYKDKSEKTTKYIEENLRAAIEREGEGKGVLQTLCSGYLNTLNQKNYSEKDNKDIYDGAIIYLFRLLFLFYSTSRDLLKRESIEKFQNIIQDSFRFCNEGGLKNDSCNLWDRLQGLYVEINEKYNGGLFNYYESDFTKFIEETKITDPFLSEVIFGLAYYQKSKGSFVPIEYRDLSVRHLGSLYEGLLEHNLFVAPENMVIRKSGSKIRYISESKAGKITRSDTILPKGKIYFSEDANERKLSGSYYTPEDVVEYIVKNTVDSLLEEKEKEIIEEITPFINDMDIAVNKSERKRFEQYIDDRIYKFVEEKILALSVLDPTMGSGHFLVNATNHITNFIVNILNEYPGNNSKIDSNPKIWRRKVVENCIFGVDLNPRAVELAKLCLWIGTTFKEKPLSFLNHHLKKGNALIGVRISDLEKQLIKTGVSDNNLFMKPYIDSIKQAAECYKKKLSKFTNTIEDIEEKKEILEEVNRELVPYKNLCDAFTFYLLGKINESEFLSKIENWDVQKIPQKGQGISGNDDFFHWEIEFPDVLYGDNSGFDCVIGNPPYVDVAKDKANKQYKCSISKTLTCRNLYAFLIEVSLNYLRKHGYFGFIVPGSIVCSERMRALQEFTKRHKVKFLNIDSTSHPGCLFKNVNTQITIVTLKYDYSEELYTTNYKRFYAKDRKNLFKNIKLVHLPNSYIQDISIPKIGSEIELRIIDKMFSKTSKRLVDFIQNTQKTTNFIFYKTSGNPYYRLAFDEPPFFEVNGVQKTSSKLRKVNLKDNVSKYIMLCLFHSSLFYMFWVMYSNCFDFTLKELSRFPIDLDELQSQDDYFKKLYLKIKEDLERNAKIVTYNKLNGVTRYMEFKARYSKQLLDAVDESLGKYYNFSEEEISHILNYDITFRID